MDEKHVKDTRKHSRAEVAVCIQASRHNTTRQRRLSIEKLSKLAATGSLLRVVIAANMLPSNEDCQIEKASLRCSAA